MLWRQSYSNSSADGITVPIFSGKSLAGVMTGLGSSVLVGGFGFASLPAIEVWRRLIVSEFADHPWLVLSLIMQGWDEDHVRLLASAIPRSQHDVWFMVADPSNSWRTALEIEGDQPFGAVIKGQVASLVVAGIPTEDTWDRFSKEIRTQLSVA